MGVSLVMTGNKKGRRLLAQTAQSAVIIPLKADEIYQEALEKPIKEPMLRKFLLRDLARKGANGRCDIELMKKKYIPIRSLPEK